MLNCSQPGNTELIPVKSKKAPEGADKRTAKSKSRIGKHQNLGSLTTESKEEDSDHLLDDKGEGEADVAITYDSQVDEMLAQEA